MANTKRTRGMKHVREREREKITVCLDYCSSLILSESEDSMIYNKYLNNHNYNLIIFKLNKVHNRSHSKAVKSQHMVLIQEVS